MLFRSILAPRSLSQTSFSRVVPALPEWSEEERDRNTLRVHQVSSRATRLSRAKKGHAPWHASPEPSQDRPEHSAFLSPTSKAMGLSVKYNDRACSHHAFRVMLQTFSHTMSVHGGWGEKWEQGERRSLNTGIQTTTTSLLPNPLDRTQWHATCLALQIIFIRVCSWSQCVLLQLS